MIDKNGYNYSDFLSDSSDDYPKYADGITTNWNKVKSSDCSQEVIDAVREASFSQPFHAEPPSNIIALENVLSLAVERVEQFQCRDVDSHTDADIVIADDSILAVKAMLNLMKAGVDLKSVEASNIALAQDDIDK